MKDLFSSMLRIPLEMAQLGADLAGSDSSTQNPVSERDQRLTQLLDHSEDVIALKHGPAPWRGDPLHTLASASTVPWGPRHELRPSGS